ncbi:HAD-IIIC family phosphatase [Paucibacter sp. APW11]|uniref:HAD-IIIC family phosphatase n=1 Tax=Roseateles aquae TaxID=3077235 RepID=A0ABU3PE52_9BURK|nr:HAD-IIIC family phosphatase [Paucibacter sp. APW11]MDT9000885.1 HAD-IIIC family phosphatase [Paucibacter sp. APW11]
MNLQDLFWLPEAAPEFRAELRELRASAQWPMAKLRQLARARLNLTQLHSLSRLLGESERVSGAKPIAISLLSNASTELIASALPATALRHDLLLNLHVPAFGQFTQESLDPVSQTRQRGNEFVVLALDHRAFQWQSCPGNAELAEQQVEQALQTLLGLVAGLRATQACSVVLQTLAAPPDSLFGSLDGQLPGSQRWMIEAFNQRLRARRIAGELLFDVAALAAQVGLAQWHDPTQWAVGKFAFAHAMVPLYAEHLARLLMAAKGKAKKCLVLDLDNTLWGGVIGDDGLAGIVLGQGHPVGEAHLQVQATALALRERGIVLAVSSKNDEAVARQVFREHPDMLLRESHIAVFQANWKDKASNLRAIAQTLNIGVDALVFLDDNPAERQQVRLELPDVGVPELPSAPEFFASTLLAAGYFEALQFTAEDSQRAEQYQANAARTAELGASSDLAGYLKSLQMRAHVAEFDAVGRARISQLINKTNQFNLTTRRYSEAEVEAFEQDPQVLGLQIRLLDRFGDNGMISVVICKPQDAQTWLIDSWLMSCRVLNRGVERQVLNVLVQCAAQRGIRQLIGQYIPTEKNSMVAEHYPRLGFTPLEAEGEVQRWQLDVEAYVPVEQPIEVLWPASASKAAD